MTTKFQLVQPPFSADFLEQLTTLSCSVFKNQDVAPLQWRLKNMPDVTVFTGAVDGNLVAFKAGYASTYNRYYSWLGGVASDYKKQGLAKTLMGQQHQWLLGSQYKLVETHVMQSNRPMVNLNHGSGMVVTGYFVKQGRANFIMQKQINC